MNKKSLVHDIVSKALFLYNFSRKKVFPVDSYDNDWLFLDDDLFCVWRDEFLFEQMEMRDNPHGVEAVQPEPDSVRGY